MKYIESFTEGMRVRDVYLCKTKNMAVTRNGKEIGRFVPKNSTVSYLTDSLTGILKDDYGLDEVKAERLLEKHGPID